MTKEELKQLKQTVDYFGHWYDVIGEERVLILEKSIEYITDLEKQNAELRKKNLSLQDAVTMQMYTNRANKEIADKQLTKAKEIIEKLYSHVFQGMGFMELNDFNVLKAEAEQFLKECE